MAQSIFEATFLREEFKITSSSTELQIKSLYDGWADTYDKDLENHGYALCKGACESFVRHVDRLSLDKNMHILDVGAGTGILGGLLKSHGFTDIDALDLSDKMLQIAAQKKAYKNLICGGIGAGHGADVGGDSYDALTCTGCWTIGHIPAVGMEEFVRIVKPGGLIHFSVRTAMIDEHQDGYAEILKRLIGDGTLEVIAKEEDDIFTDKSVEAYLKRCYLYTCRVHK